MSLIWHVTYSFNITLALGYIVLGIVLDCKPTPVPGLSILTSQKKVRSEDNQTTTQWEFPCVTYRSTCEPAALSFRYLVELLDSCQFRDDKEEAPPIIAS